MNRYRIMRAASFLLLVFAASTTAFAGWEVIYLHPAEASSSEAWAVSSTRQAGSVTVNIDDGRHAHAVIWSGTSESWVDLNPDGYLASYIADISGEQQVGYAFPPGWTFLQFHAGTWSGSAQSWVDLHPAGAHSSWANGIFGDEQIGGVLFPGGVVPDVHASLWKGTAESRVDLHPAGAVWSEAAAISGGQQVGSANFGGGIPTFGQAGLWTGSAESWVDLHPAGSSYSYAVNVSDGQQVGAAYFWDDGVVGGLWSAGLWSSTAESWVALNPVGSSESRAYGVSKGYQVGYVTLDYIHRASIWSGTAESFSDLHDLLGPEYSASEARSIDVSGGDIWVAGTAYRGNIGHAVLWHFTIPEPSSPVALVGGIVGLAVIRRRR